MLLKVMHGRVSAPDDDARQDHSVYADVTECSFKKHKDGSAMAHIWVREPVKTAQVPGFVDIEKHIDLGGNAYLMNDAGKTVSSYCPDRIPDAIALSSAEADRRHELPTYLYIQKVWKELNRLDAERPDLKEVLAPFWEGVADAAYHFVVDGQGMSDAPVTVNA